MKTERQITLAVHLARSLRAARRDYRRRLKRCRKKFSEKAVHDLRVETRRLLTLLDFMEAAQLADSPGKTRKMLKRRLDAFDDLRDTQVQLQLLQPLGREFPGVKRLRKLLRRQEQRLVKQTRKNVEHAKPGGLWLGLKALEKQIRAATIATPQADGHQAAVAPLQKSFDRVVRLRRRIHGDDAAAIHKLRIAFKRFRYLSELLRPFLPWLTQDQLRRMREFQASAGDIQDLEILLTRLDEFVQEKKLPAGALRSLRNELARRKHRAVNLFKKQIAALQEFQPDERAAQSSATG